MSKLIELIVSLIKKLTSKKAVSNGIGIVQQIVVVSNELPSPGDWIRNAKECLLNGFYEEVDSNNILQTRLRKIYLMGDLPEKLTEDPLVDVMELKNSNSMDGLMDIGHNPICIKGANPHDHQLLIDRLIEGDVAVYSANGRLIIHRVYAISYDDDGSIYFTFKGDNPISNVQPDPYIIRNFHIVNIMVGVVH